MASITIGNPSRIRDKSITENLDDSLKNLPVVDLETGIAYSNKILLLVSAPLLSPQRDAEGNFKEVRPLSIQEEIESVVEALKRIQKEIALTLEVKVATFDILQELTFSETPPLIIHFIGHGTKMGGENSLVLEDEEGFGQEYSVSQLKMLFGKYLQRPPCQLALLNACYSEGVAKVLLDSGVNHVVAINAEDKVLDRVAKKFAKYFYEPLFSGHDVIDAYYVAKHSIAADPSLKSNLQEYIFSNLDESVKFKLNLI